MLTRRLDGGGARQVVFEKRRFLRPEFSRNVPVLLPRLMAMERILHVLIGRFSTRLAAIARHPVATDDFRQRFTKPIGLSPTTPTPMSFASHPDSPNHNPYAGRADSYSADHGDFGPQYDSLAAADAPTHPVLLGYLFWILGFTGAHRFYFGKPLTGAIWFFTGGLFLIGWIIDLFLIPTMAEQANRRYHTSDVDHSVAWVLLLFLGIFGVHRLYMGKIFTGLIYLVTGGLLGIGVVYDICTLNEQIEELRY